MARFWKHAKDVIDQSDILIEVLDARQIQESRNLEIEHKVKNAGKKLLYVVNKIDLLNEKDSASVEEKIKKVFKLNPCVFISSIKKLGTTILKKKIRELARGEEAIVGVLGYPNVGKSSLINALCGRRAARTSSKSGFTRGMQKVRVDGNILLLDSPGVFPYQERDDLRHAKIAAIDPGQLKDAETVALRFIDEKKEMVIKHYGLLEDEKLKEDLDVEDAESILEAVAIKHNFFLKKKDADLIRAARKVLKDWQIGKLR